MAFGQMMEKKMGNIVKFVEDRVYKDHIKELATPNKAVDTVPEEGTIVDGQTPVASSAMHLNSKGARSPGCHTRPSTSLSRRTTRMAFTATSGRPLVLTGGGGHLH